MTAGTTVTTTKRHAIQEMAFNALFDQMTEDTTFGDGVLPDLSPAAAVTPDGTAEIRRTTSTIARRLGITRGKALTYCEIGTMLTRLPATADAVAGGAFSLDLLRIIAEVTCCVEITHLPAVDTELAVLLTPPDPTGRSPDP